MNINEIRRMQQLAGIKINEAKTKEKVDANGTRIFYTGSGGNLKVHNAEGPAKIYADGSVEYYLNGKRMDQVQWEQAVRGKQNAKIDRFNQAPDKVTIDDGRGAGMYCVVGISETGEEFNVASGVSKSRAMAELDKAHEDYPEARGFTIEKMGQYANTSDLDDHEDGRY